MARRELDFYPTPTWMTAHLMREGLSRELLRYTGHVPVALEPCVGEGHIVRAINRQNPDVIWSTNDLDPRHEAHSHVDAGTDEFWGSYSRDVERPDWVISNPPFSEAARIIPRAYEATKVGVAMLLRITWLEPCEERKVWLASHPPTWMLVMERYSFRQNGSQDSATTAWLVWVKDPNAGPQRIVVVPGRGVQPALGEMTL